MQQTPKSIHHPSQQIRKLKQLSVHDCATFVGISEDQFQMFEGGTTYLSVPEIELLVYYLGVPLHPFLEGVNMENKQPYNLKEKTQAEYKKIRNKMICARLSIEMERAQKSLTDIHQATQISMETLHSYISGDLVIGSDHLLQICEALEQSVAVFFNQDLSPVNQLSAKDLLDWEKEFLLEDYNTEVNEEDAYRFLTSAVKKMPKEDQAKIAKIILTKLKTY